MPFILDVAPARDGYVADIGYADALGQNRVQMQLKEDLLAIRQLILAAVRAEKSLREIYDDVDDVIEDLGYENCHQRYPLRVLGHRVARLPKVSRVMLGLGASVFPFAARELLAGRPTIWNDSRRSDVRPSQSAGLWAVEPHLGFHGVGAKWEELLVIGAGNAHWLDDDLPHVRVGAARRHA